MERNCMAIWTQLYVRHCIAASAKCISSDSLTVKMTDEETTNCKTWGPSYCVVCCSRQEFHQEKVPTHTHTHSTLRQQNRRTRAFDKSSSCSTIHTCAQAGLLHTYQWQLFHPWPIPAIAKWGCQAHWGPSSSFLQRVAQCKRPRPSRYWGNAPFGSW